MTPSHSFSRSMGEGESPTDVRIPDDCAMTEMPENPSEKAQSITPVCPPTDAATDVPVVNSRTADIPAKTSCGARRNVSGTSISRSVT